MTMIELLVPRFVPCAAHRLGPSPHPHSLNPHTWHFTHPSAYSSCDPQSGHVPINPPLSVTASNPSCPCAPPNVASPLALGATRTDPVICSLAGTPPCFDPPSPKSSC